jgi:hypothetical protein
MAPKTILYVDIDDTLISKCFPGSGFDLRPGVITQLRYLSRLFDCFWLTHWDQDRVHRLLRTLYAQRLESQILYANWRAVDPSNKAPYVLAHDHNFYWVEDLLSTGKLNQLIDAGLADRYIPVDPNGLWGFTRAIRTLFDKAGIKEAQIKRVGAEPQWFQEPLGDHFDWTFYE